METVLQQAINQQQVLENVMREFAVKTSTDPKIADIFQRNQLMSTNAPSAQSPSAKE
jgi:truncated hemoglobin YjbI